MQGHVEVNLKHAGLPKKPLASVDSKVFLVHSKEYQKIICFYTRWWVEQLEGEADNQPVDDPVDKEKNKNRAECK